MYDFCLTIPYGMLLGVGGLIGYASSGSTTSALAGVGSGIFLTGVGFLSYNEYTQSPVVSKLWAGLSLGVSSGLTFVMGKRYNETGLLFPAGAVALMSAGMSIFYIIKLVENPKPVYRKKH